MAFIDAATGFRRTRGEMRCSYRLLRDDARFLLWPSEPLIKCASGPATLVNDLSKGRVARQVGRFGFLLRTTCGRTDYPAAPIPHMHQSTESALGIHFDKPFSFRFASELRNHFFEIREFGAQVG